MRKVRPDEYIKITNKAMAVMIKRVLGIKGKVLIADSVYFTDNADIAEYAVSAVYELKASGIIKGYENAFLPKNSLTRAEAASVIYAFINTISE